MSPRDSSCFAAASLVQDWKSGGKDDWKSGGKDDWKSGGGKDDWKSGGKDDWKSGGKDDWKSGGKDDWKSGGGKDDWKSQADIPQVVSCCLAQSLCSATVVCWAPAQHAPQHRIAADRPSKHGIVGWPWCIPGQHVTPDPEKRPLPTFTSPSTSEGFSRISSIMASGAIFVIYSPIVSHHKHIYLSRNWKFITKLLLLLPHWEPFPGQPTC